MEGEILSCVLSSLWTPVGINRGDTDRDHGRGDPGGERPGSANADCELPGSGRAAEGQLQLQRQQQSAPPTRCDSAENPTEIARLAKIPARTDMMRKGYRTSTGCWELRAAKFEERLFTLACDYDCPKGRSPARMRLDPQLRAVEGDARRVGRDAGEEHRRTLLSTSESTRR